MWKVKLPKKSHAVTELLTALTYADGTPKYAISQQEKQDIKHIYTAYERARGIAVPKLLCQSFKDSFLTAIQEGYKEVQKGGRLVDLRDRLMASTNRCPCCGINPVDELDHHLPQSTYKAFSVYSSNLVPICHTCNNKKRAVTGINPDERFIHVYYNEIPENVQFLFASVQLQGSKMNFNFEIHKIPELPDQLYKQMSFQVKRIELQDRLIAELNIFLNPLAYAIKSNYENYGKDAVKLLLKGTSETLRKQYGLNHWRPIVIHALAEHNRFCDGGFYKPLGITPSP